jgi:hypothetical protein
MSLQAAHVRAAVCPGDIVIYNWYRDGDGLVNGQRYLVLQVFTLRHTKPMEVIEVEGCEGSLFPSGRFMAAPEL